MPNTVEILSDNGDGTLTLKISLEDGFTAQQDVVKPDDGTDMNAWLINYGRDYMTGRQQALADQAAAQAPVAPPVTF